MVEADNITLSKKNFKENITSLQDIVEKYRLTLEGYIWSGQSNSYIYTGKPLATTRIIDLLVGLLTPFTNNANLITIKDFETFNNQQYLFCKEVNKILHKDPYGSVENYTQIFQMTDDTFINIMDIMLGSKSFMKDITAPLDIPNNEI